MDEDSDGRFLSRIINLFRSKTNSHDLEEHILDAKDEGAIPAEQVSMLLNVLDLGKTRVEDIMVPRIDIACAEADASLEELAGLIVTCGHSRIPIFEETKDRMVGIVHAKDLLRPLLDPHCQGQAPCGPKNIMRPIFFVNAQASVRSLLRQFQNERMHLGIVQDEYGGTAGLVTMEDVLEEIVGDIEDEYDALRPDEIERREDGSMLCSGRTLLEDVNTALGLDLASEDVESIGGYLTELAGAVPADGESFDLGPWRFIVQDADAKHVRLVRIEPLPNRPETSKA